MSFKLTDTRIDPIRLLSHSAGAYCSYEGWVRDFNRGKPVTSLHYEAYAQMAPAIAASIIAEAKAKFTIAQAAIVHRTGRLSVGEIAVWIGVTAHHRGDTFSACRYLIDNVKCRLPIWKKELYADGGEAWIDGNDCHCAAEEHRPHP